MKKRPLNLRLEIANKLYHDNEDILLQMRGKVFVAAYSAATADAYPAYYASTYASSTKVKNVAKALILLQESLGKAER